MGKGSALFMKMVIKEKLFAPTCPTIINNSFYSNHYYYRSEHVSLAFHFAHSIGILLDFIL